MLSRSNCSISNVVFKTEEDFDSEQAKEYAKQQLQKGNFQNCTIGKVYVNEKLVLENIKIC